MLIEKSRHSIQCKTNHTFLVDDKGFAAWEDGGLIQRCLPDLSKDLRELLISGLCGACFDKVFSDVNSAENEEYRQRSNIQQNREYAKKNGWEVVLPRVDELLIDLDSPEAVTEFDTRFAFAAKEFKLEEVARTDSKSGGGRKHVTVRVLGTPLTDSLRVMFQAILGSDYRRELYSLRHIIKGHNCPTIFFELDKNAQPPAHKGRGQRLPRLGG